MKGQKRGICRTCDGPIHFYPRRESDGQPVVEDGEVVGDWAHINPSDWIKNAHAVDPVDEEQAS